jgi:hypothetical protein
MNALTDFHFATLSFPVIALGVGGLVLIGLAVCMSNWVKAQFEWRSFRFSLETGKRKPRAGNKRD